MDLSRLSRGEQILGASGLVLLLFSILPFWSKYEVGDLGFGVGGATERTTIWSAAFSFLPKLGMFLVIFALILLVTRLLSPNLELPVGAGPVYLGLMSVAAVCLAIALISGPAFSGLSGAGFEASRGPLLFIGWLIAGVGAYGGYLHMQEENAAPAPAPATPPPTQPPPPAAP